MSRSEAEDAGGRLPVKDDNEAAVHFNRRTLAFFNCGDYNHRAVRRRPQELSFFADTPLLDR